MRWRQFQWVTAVLASCLCLTATSAGAASPSVGESSSDVVAYPDGKVLSVGQTICPRYPNVCGPNYIVARFNSDGTPDQTFGVEGQAPVGREGYTPLIPSSVAVDDLGRVLVAGKAVDISKDSDFGLVRYLPNGTLDPDFGGAGIVRTDIANHAWDSATSIAIDAEGRIVLAGVSAPPASMPSFVAARYLSDGSLDPSFGEGGRVVLPLVGSRGAGVEALLIDRLGRIVLAGRGQLARLRPDGSPDPGFSLNREPTGLETAGVVEDEPHNRYLVALTSHGGKCSDCRDGLVQWVPSDGSGHPTSIRSFAGVEMRSINVDALGRPIVTGRWGREPKRKIFVAELSGAANPAPDFNARKPLLFTPSGADSVAIGSASIGADLVTVAQIRGHCMGKTGNWQPTTCSAIALIARNEDGSPKGSIGGVGFRTDPITHRCSFAPYRRCGVDLRSTDLKSILKSLNPRFAISGSVGKLALRCPKLVETSCLFILTISVRGSPVHLARRNAGVKAGRARTLRWHLAPNRRGPLAHGIAFLSISLKGDGSEGRLREKLRVVGR